MTQPVSFTISASVRVSRWTALLLRRAVFCSRSIRLPISFAERRTSSLAIDGWTRSPSHGSSSSAESTMRHR